jgi:hypothetical protein
MVLVQSACANLWKMRGLNSAGMRRREQLQRRETVPRPFPATRVPLPQN